MFVVFANFPKFVICDFFSLSLISYCFPNLFRVYNFVLFFIKCPLPNYLSVRPPKLNVPLFILSMRKANKGRRERTVVSIPVCVLLSPLQGSVQKLL